MIYLDNAATSYPKPKSVVDAVYKSLTDGYTNSGRSGHKYSLKATKAIEETRESISDLLNCDPTNVFFTLNCTDSLCNVIFGYVKQNDHIITSVFDHNSVLRPLEYLKKKGVIDYNYALPDENNIINSNSIKKLLKPNTSMVIVSHVSNVCGAICDIDSIRKFCMDNKIVFCIDAAQSAGVKNITSKDADIICAPGHKGLQGPMGCGILYISPTLEIRPLRMGGTGSQSESLDQPYYRPDKYESGTLPLPAIMGLNEGINFIKNNISEIEEKEISLINLLRSELLNNNKVVVYLSDVNNSNVLLFNIKDMDSKEVSEILSDEYNIATRPGFHCAFLTHKYLNTVNTGGVRVSVGLFNTENDIKALINAVNKISKQIV